MPKLPPSYSTEIALATSVVLLKALLKAINLVSVGHAVELVSLVLEALR